MKDHETMRNEQADRELDLRAKLIRAKQDNDRERLFVAIGTTSDPDGPAIVWRLA